jgi:hypothetical protein
MDRIVTGDSIRCVDNDKGSLTLTIGKLYTVLQPKIYETNHCVRVFNDDGIECPYNRSRFEIASTRGTVSIKLTDGTSETYNYRRVGDVGSMDVMLEMVGDTFEVEEYAGNGLVQICEGKPYKPGWVVDRITKVQNDRSGLVIKYIVKRSA